MWNHALVKFERFASQIRLKIRLILSRITGLKDAIAIFSAIARTGVDYISIGALTHSPRALDISLEII